MRPRVGNFLPGHVLQPLHLDESTHVTAGSGVPPTDSMDSVASGAVEMESCASAQSPPGEASNKGRGLRRWRRIPRDQYYHRNSEGSPDAGGGGAAQLHKRRLIPLVADARATPKGKHEVVAVEEESSVESRFVPLDPAQASLDPDLGLLVASTVFSVGADSDNNEDRNSKSSTAASAPRHDLPASTRERDRGRCLHGENHRTARARANRWRVYTSFSPSEVENSRSSVESNLRSSNAINGRKPGVGVTGNGVHKALSHGDDHSDDEQASEEATPRFGDYHKENGNVGEGKNGLRVKSDADPYSESILLLQRTQETLENEIQKFVVIGKESSDVFAVHNDEWSDSVHLEEPVEEASYKVKDLESRMEEVSTLIKEKDSRILELEALSRTRAWRSAIQSTNTLLLQPDLDQLLQEKMEAEIQSIILARASQTWTPLIKDKTDLYEQERTLYRDYKQLEIKLRHTENRAAMLGEVAAQLETQCKELSASSEILQLQSRASSLSLCCFIQFMLLFITIGTFLMRILPSSADLVPT